MKTLSAAILVFWFTVTLPAQYLSMYGYQSNLADAHLANMRYLMNNSSLMLTRTLKAQAERRVREQGRATSSQGSGAASSGVQLAGPPPDFTFPYQGRLLSMESMAATLAKAPDARPQVARELETLVRTVAEGLEQGGTPYDLSKAFALYTATMYSILHPETALDQNTISRLRRQYQFQLLNVESRQRTAPAKMQEQWEALLATTGIALMSYEQARRQQNAEGVASIRNSAITGLRTLFQVDPAQIRMDPQAEWPLWVAAEAAPPQGNSVSSAPPAAPAASGWPSPPSSANGVIRVGHHHTFTGMHPAELRLEPDGVVFDPLGQSCSQSLVRVAYADVQVGNPSPNSQGELLLNVKMRNPKNPSKMLNFNFVTEDSIVENTSSGTIVRSPPDAAVRLSQIAAELRARGAH
ncbi:MAG: hypothetical protein LC114_15625 [Bryobacterales bacterium]|nr:hypothetical protein [Bryobacterales bacterium]